MNDPMDGGAPLERSYANAARCSAKSKQSGVQCKNYAIAGGTVCRFHGGAIPSVRRRARLRLAELVDPAIATLGREMVKAEKSADRQRAANSILDRGGVPRTSHVRGQMSLEESKALLIERILEIRASGGGDQASLAAGEIVEAEIVDDGDEER